MKYKLVAIDLDGTLLTDHKTMTQETIKTLRQVDNLGVEIVIATGRRYWSSKELIKQLELNLVILANNGTIIRQSSDDKPIISKYIEEDDFYKLMVKSQERDLHPILHVNHYDEGYDILIELDRLDPRYTSYLSKMEHRYRRIPSLMEYTSPQVMVACYTGSYDVLKAFEDDIQEQYPGRYNSHIMTLTSIGAILEFMSRKGSKWLSLKEYASSKGIDREEIIAIGDDNNDVEMIAKAGLGIAMENCTDEVKKAADVITEKSNNESGVAHILGRIFKL